MSAPHLTRRDFLAGLGGIVLSFTLVPTVGLGQDAVRLPGSLQTNRTLDAWLRINTDGSVTVFTGKVELGQGIVTALAQIAAEELDVPLEHEWANDPERVATVTIDLVDDLGEAVAIANERTSGLAAGIVTEDADAAEPQAARAMRES